jgi:hypothetical protein
MYDVVDIGNRGDYPKGTVGDEEYEQCKKWARHISLLGNRKPDSFTVWSFVSCYHKDILGDITREFSASTFKGHLSVKNAGELSFVYKQMIDVVKLANHILSARNIEFIDKDMLLYLLVMAAYVVSKNIHATYMDLVKILRGGQSITYIPEAYVKDERRLSIGMIPKLLGLHTTGRTAKMDCPRVWDLETDEIVSNPNFHGKKVPIVVVTHTWISTEDEITYKDLLELQRKNVILEAMGKSQVDIKISEIKKVTENSVKATDKLARIREELRRKIRYVWMDTLCIDKTSSAELDEGIRSMYRWYREAEYVYLEYYTDLKRWATRGWTLQEGAAAKVLRVSPKHGTSFLDALCKAYPDGDTNGAVCGLALGVSRIRNDAAYWIHLMSLRDTTKKEDKAYALVGLLGLDLQSAYGEGEDASMRRLCEELVRQKQDVSWLITEKFRNGKWTNLNYKIPNQDDSLSKEELSNREDFATFHDEIQVIGHGIKLDVVRVEGLYKRKLQDIKFGSHLYKDILKINQASHDMLEQTSWYKIVLWWVPSNNILLYMCRYKTKNKIKDFWRIIWARGVPARWKCPPLETHTLVIDYGTNIYEHDFMDDLPDDIIHPKKP